LTVLLLCKKALIILIFLCIFLLLYIIVAGFGRLHKYESRSDCLCLIGI